MGKGLPHTLQGATMFKLDQIADGFMKQASFLSRRSPFNADLIYAEMLFALTQLAGKPLRNGRGKLIDQKPSYIAKRVGSYALGRLKKEKTYATKCSISFDYKPKAGEHAYSRKSVTKSEKDNDAFFFHVCNIFTPAVDVSDCPCNLASLLSEIAAVHGVNLDTAILTVEDETSERLAELEAYLSALDDTSQKVAAHVLAKTPVHAIEKLGMSRRAALRTRQEIFNILAA